MTIEYRWAEAQYDRMPAIDCAGIINRQGANPLMPRMRIPSHHVRQQFPVYKERGNPVKALLRVCSRVCLRARTPRCWQKACYAKSESQRAFTARLATRSWAWRGLVSFCGPAKEARGLGTSVPYITSAPRERAYIGACLAFARECLR